MISDQYQTRSSHELYLQRLQTKQKHDQQQDEREDYDLLLPEA